MKYTVTLRGIDYSFLRYAELAEGDYDYFMDIYKNKKNVYLEDLISKSEFVPISANFMFTNRNEVVIKNAEGNTITRSSLDFNDICKTPIRFLVDRDSPYDSDCVKILDNKDYFFMEYYVAVESNIIIETDSEFDIAKLGLVIQKISPIAIPYNYFNELTAPLFSVIEFYYDNKYYPAFSEDLFLSYPLRLSLSVRKSLPKKYSLNSKIPTISYSLPEKKLIKLEKNIRHFGRKWSAFEEEPEITEQFLGTLQPIKKHAA